jgi:hypothetical protein
MLKKLGLLIVVAGILTVVYLMRQGASFGTALAEIGTWVVNAIMNFVNFVNSN